MFNKGRRSIAFCKSQAVLVFYKDSAATILESTSLTSRAYFLSSYKHIPVGRYLLKQSFNSSKTISYIAQMTLQETTLNNFDNNVVIKPEMLSTQIPIKINNYSPIYSAGGRCFFLWGCGSKRCFRLASIY